MLNAFQRTCAEIYGDGDFATVQTIEQARATGDTLFTFLMVELGSSEGCDSRDEALRRLDMASTDIQRVVDAILRIDPVAPH